jgi:hypothetical protein
LTDSDKDDLSDDLSDLFASAQTSPSALQQALATAKTLVSEKLEEMKD